MANELNKVEGFNPLDYARQITDGNGNTSLYLDVQYRKMWFRLANPNGKIVKKICNFDGNLAVVEAKVYLDKNDSEENFVSNAFAQRFADPSNMEYASRYLESAETAAVGRALADAGYGLQFCAEPDMLLVDSPQNFPQMPSPPTMNNAAPPPTMNSSTPPYNAPNNTPQYNIPMSNNGNQYGVPANNGYHQPYNAPYQNNMQYATPSAPAYNENMPAEELARQMSYEDAVKLIYPCNGNHKGQTLGQIAIEDFSCIEWIVNNLSQPKYNLIRAGAIVIRNKHKGRA